MAETVGRRYVLTTPVNTNTPWRDELSDAISLQQSGPGVSRNATESTVDFTAASNLSDFMYANIQLNHDKDLTSSIYPHIHWFQALNASPNFLIAYRWQINTGTKVTTWTYLTCNNLEVTYSSGTIHQVSYSAPIVPPTNAFMSDIVQFKIFRDNANTSGLFTGADGYAATASVIAFDIHFTIDAHGSRLEWSKL